MRAVFILSSVLGLAACASTPPPAPVAAGADNQAVAAAAEPKVVCHRVTPTGSNIPHTVCEKETRIDAQTLQTQAELAAAAQRSRPLVTHN